MLKFGNFFNIGPVYISVNITADVSPSWRAWLLGTDQNTQIHRSYGSRIRNSEASSGQLLSEEMARWLLNSV